MTLYQRIAKEGLAVIIPSYNNQQFLNQCIESVLYHSIVSQVIVVDDGSSDDSLHIAHNIKDDRLQVLTHKGCINRGRSETRNLGLKYNTEPWVGFCDSDDYWLANRFDSFHDEYPQDLDGIYGKLESLFTKEEYKKVYPMGIIGIPDQINPEDLLEYLVFSNHHISFNALIVKSNKISEVGSFDSRLELAEDTDLIWRLAGCGVLYPELIDKPISVRRIHSGCSRLDQESIIRNQRLLYELWLKNGRHSILSIKAKTLLRIKMSRNLNNSI